MNKAEQFIQQKLEARVQNNSLRKLSSQKLPIDFCSNDYLGFARSEELKLKTEQVLKQYASDYKNGATGSRLLSGNHNLTTETESFIAAFHQAESGLIFNSGYDANVGLISSLAQRGDTIISDELIHASLIDGARLSHASRFTFKHNDLNDLANKLKASKGNIYVIVESVYSMDGDIAPLIEINALCEQHEANLIVDEAHAIGIFGDHGNGLVQQLNLQTKVFARIVTFGKSLGCHGAIVLGSKSLRNFLINFARSFIYTTAAPLHTIATIKAAYHMLMDTDYSQLIHEKINLYTSTITDCGYDDKYINSSPIQTIRFNNANTAKTIAFKLQQHGLDIRAILSPTVPEGKERLRICIHLFNTEEEIRTLINQLKNTHYNE